MPSTDKFINLAVDFGIDRTKPENKEAPDDIKNTVMWLGEIISLGYKEGLNSDKRRIWTNIQTRLNENVNNKEPLFKVNEYELLFFKSAFEKAVVPTNLSAAVTKVEDAVMGAKTE